MISNDIQYRNTKAWFARFEASAAELEASAGSKRTRLQQLQIDASTAQADDLRAELTNYEALR